MDDLVYCRNIAALFHIYLCLDRLLEVLQFQTDPDLQRLHYVWNLFYINSEGKDQHIHTEMMSDNSKISADALEQLHLRLTEVQEMIPKG